MAFRIVVSALLYSIVTHLAIVSMILIPISEFGIFLDVTDGRRALILSVAASAKGGITNSYPYSTTGIHQRRALTRASSAVSGFQQLKRGIELANSAAAKNGQGKLPVTVALSTDVLLTGPLPRIAQNSSLTVTSACKTEEGLPRMCIIDGAKMFAVFRSVAVTNAGCYLKIKNVHITQAKGGIFALACTLNATDSMFSNSISSTGSAVVSYTGKFGTLPEASPGATFTRCTFFNNKAGQKSLGGAVLSAGHTKFGLGQFFFDTCTFINNRSPGKSLQGGAIRVSGSGLAHFKSCFFQGNIAGSKGGAIFSDGSNITAISTIFNGNQARDGSAISITGNYFSQPELKLCSSQFPSNGKEGSDIFLGPAFPFQGSVTLCKTVPAGFIVKKFWTLNTVCNGECLQA